MGYPSHRRLIIFPRHLRFRYRYRYLCLVGLLALAGCSATSVGVQAPAPRDVAAPLCRALHGALPDTVDGKGSRTTDPVSDFTAAWGDPAIVLRCGLALPKVLTPGDKHYNPTADAVGVEDVDWLFEEQPDGFVFTTVDRKATIEVRVPNKYRFHETSTLVDLAKAVKKTVPVTL